MDDIDKYRISVELITDILLTFLLGVPYENNLEIPDLIKDYPWRSHAYTTQTDVLSIREIILRRLRQIKDIEEIETLALSLEEVWNVRPR